MSRDPIEHARELATQSLIGHEGIVGVGRTSEALVFFVNDRDAAEPLLRRFSEHRSVPIEVRDVGGFDPAGGDG